MYVMLLNGFNVCKFSLRCPLQTLLLSLSVPFYYCRCHMFVYAYMHVSTNIFKKWNARIIHNNVQHSERPLKFERNKTTAHTSQHTSLFQSNINVIKISLSSYFPVNILFVLVSPQFISILWHFYVSLHPHVNCFLLAQMLSVLLFFVCSFLLLCFLCCIYLSCVFIQSFFFFGFISLILIFFVDYLSNTFWMVCSWIHWKLFQKVLICFAWACVCCFFLLFRLNSECWEWVLDAQTKSVDPIRFFFFLFLSVDSILVDKQSNGYLLLPS